MYFKIVGTISKIETIAVENKIRQIKRLRKFYGKGRWKKMKGFAKLRLFTGEIVEAELHWYEAHGIGKEELKIKRIVKKL